MQLKLDHLESGQKEVKSEIKYLSTKMDAKFDKMDAKMDKKYDKMDGKIDRLLYAIIGGFATVILKGGFDFYISEKQKQDHATQKKQ